MMKREDQYLYLMDRNLFCHVVGVPYQGNATAFFILPNEGRMQKLEAGLNKETLRKWLKILTKRYSSASTRASLTRHTPRETHVPKGHSGGKDSHTAQELSPSPEASGEVPAPQAWSRHKEPALLVVPLEWTVTSGAACLSSEWNGLYSRQGAEGSL